MILFSDAYKVSCLGVTNRDWEHLAISSLKGNNLEISRKSFVHTKNYKFLTLISFLQVKFLTKLFISLKKNEK
jgi:intraflagellar transport protein 122